MKERVVVLGARKSLVGVLTEPTVVTDGNPAVLLLNAGVIHRIGPNRVYVKLARKLAELGFAVLRFDPSGRGDSETRKDEAPSSTDAEIAEIVGAMNYVQQVTGAGQFIVGGICSGAANGLAVANLDSRVVGLVAIDGFADNTVRSIIIHFSRRLFRLSSWTNTLRGGNSLGRRLYRLAGLASTTDDTGELIGLAARSAVPSREAVAGILRTLTSRNVCLLQVFSGGGEDGDGIYRYERQFVDAFPDVDFKDLLTLVFARDADHTFTTVSSQGKLVSLISDWIKSAPFAVRLSENAGSHGEGSRRTSAALGTD
jgi:pimeloyl-ACP methyl ester carboxylesterase